MTNIELAILSLLAEKSRHGYEIEQTIEERGMREWTEIGFSSIYYILKKCLQAGWVEETLLPSESKGPGKKVYKLTESGSGSLANSCAWNVGGTFENLPSARPGVGKPSIITCI